MLSKNAFLLFDAAKVRRFSRPRKSFQRTARFLQQNAYTPIHEVVPNAVSIADIIDASICNDHFTISFLLIM